MQYFGWGGEDDDLFQRLKYKQIEVIRLNISYSQYVMMKHEQQTPNSFRHSLLRNAAHRIQSDGLNSLEFREKVVKQLPLYTHIEVEI